MVITALPRNGTNIQRIPTKGNPREDGIWFGGSEPDDGKGALPYGVYTIEELRCEANAGHKLVKFDVSIKRDNYTVAPWDCNK